MKDLHDMMGLDIFLAGRHTLRPERIRKKMKRPKTNTHPLLCWDIASGIFHRRDAGAQRLRKDIPGDPLAS